MTTVNGLESAKQGNPIAIAALMNKSLQPKGITVTATAAGGCLTVVAESEVLPEQSSLVSCIRQGITSLSPKSVERVVVQGKATGQKHSGWRESFMLSGEPSTAINNSKFTNMVDAVKPVKRLNPMNLLKSSRELINTALLAGILLALVASAWSNGRSKPVYWEYRVEGVEDLSFDYTMQRLGAEGWDLTSARRAVSGEGSSSRGLYEVILRKPITYSQAQQNLKDLELSAKQSLAKTYISSINRSQQAYHIENDLFSLTLSGLDLGFVEDTEDYALSLSLDGTDKALATASSKTGELKSYTGAVVVISDRTRSIVCESDSPSKTAPASPVINNDELQCAPGSSEAD